MKMPRLGPIRDHPAFAAIMTASHSDHRYAGVWSSDWRFEASLIHGLDPVAHLRKCREKIAEGYPPHIVGGEPDRNRRTSGDRLGLAPPGDH